MELLKSDGVIWVADMVVTVILLKGALLAAGLAAAVALSRRTSAALRSTVWTLGFGGLLALPLAWMLVPWWPAELLAFPTGLFSPLEAPFAIATGPGAGAVFGGSASAIGAAALGGVPLASFLALGWITGTTLLLVRFQVQRVRVERMAGEGFPVDDEPCLLLARRIAGELGVTRPVRLVYHALLATPATYGVRRPVVLLPAAARRWTQDRLSVVLYHELAHVQRHDYAALVLFELTRALYWPNPLVLMAAVRARESQDHACDDTALRSGVTPPVYARQLTEVARTLGTSTLGTSRTAGAVLPLIRRSGLRGRVRAILAADSDRRGVSGGVVARLAVLGLLLSAGLGSANLWICESDAGPHLQAGDVARPDGPAASEPS